MGCKKKSLGMGWMMLAAKSSPGFFAPAGAWTDPEDLANARAFGEMRAKSTGGTFTATPCLEYTNDVRVPVGRVNIGNSINADGVLDPTTATSIATAANYRFARPGWWIVGDGSTPAFAMLAGVIVLLEA